MKIALIGGIYGSSDEYRRKISFTPETTLEMGLRNKGHHVDTFGLDDRPEYNRYDLVHVHHLGKGTLRVAADPGDVPVVFSVHAFPQQSANGPEPQGLPFQHRAALAFVMRRIDALVSLSTAEQQYEEGAYQLEGAYRAVIPNGIPEQWFQRARTVRAAGDPWRLLYVGQLIANKKVDVLLRALRHIDMPFTLNLVYQHAPAEQELRSLAAELGIADRVHFLGARTAAQIAQLQNSTDLFTFPSAFEAFPSVLIEAMLCGTPIVSTNVGGIPELLGRFGRTCPPNDVEALADAIRSVLESYDEWFAQSAEMRAEALRRFAVGAMVDRHERFYQEVLANRRKPRRRKLGTAPANLIVRAFVNRWMR